MPDTKPYFSSEFAVPDEAQWMALVEKTLKGKPFAKAMQHRTHDDIIVDALGTRRCGQPSGQQPMRAHGNWAVTSLIWGPDSAQNNKDILVDLERGASAVTLNVSEGGGGVSPSNLAEALEGVYLDMVPLTLNPCGDDEAAATAYEKLVRKRGYKRNTLSGSLGINPIGTLARSGKLPTTAEQAVEAGAEIAARWGKQQPRVATFNASGSTFADAGASEGTEIAAAVSSAICYMRAMEQAGLSLEAAATQIQFTFSASAELWLTVAKFRAARRVWAGVLTACGVENVPMRINGVSAHSTVTMVDPWVNILRGTAACFAAAIGGADIITTLPHDREYGDCDSFSRRVARNIQIILMEESNLARVSDPAAGSYALEQMTCDLANKSAELLADLESTGGIVASLRSGTLADAIAGTADKRKAGVRKRKVGITGVSEFPDIHETPLEGPGDIYTTKPVQFPAPVERVRHLPLYRQAREFERLRFNSYFDETRPLIALVNLGPAADFTARAAFSKNFFEAGGIEAVACSGAETIEDAVTAYGVSKAKIAIICGTDERYGEIGVNLARALKVAGCTRLYLAGKPVNAGKLEAAGVDECVYNGCDVIDALERAYVALGNKKAGDAL